MRQSYFGFTAAAAIAVMSAACGSQEGQVIENFFRAVQAKDTQTISSFSVAQFDKTVKSWKVKEIGQEQRSAAPLAGLAAALKAADDAVAENKKNASAYFNAHPLEVDKVKPLVDAGSAVPANLKQTADDWKKFNDDDKALKVKAAEAKIAYDREKRLVEMSTGQKGAEADALTGDLVTKTATVEVESEGDVKTYSIQIRKYEVSAPGQTVKVMSRWLIQTITPQ